MPTIKIVKEGPRWAPIINGKKLKALSTVEVAIGLEAYILIANEKTVEAPKEFWEELANAPYQGGVD